MTRLFLAAGVAALAISAPLAAERGGKGGENKGQAAKVERGGGKSKAAGMERKGGGNRVVAVERGGKGKGLKAEHVNRVAVRGGKGKSEKFEHKSGRDDIRVRGHRDENRFDQRFASRGLINGDCPPGLWKKDPPCVPPGQAKNAGLLGQVLPAAYRDSLLPLGLRDFYRDSDDYYYRLGNNGFLYQVDRRSNLVESLLPLLGGGLMTGQMFPSAFNNYYVPTQYQPFYLDTPDHYYRYNNGYVYQVDRGTSLIQALIPLLTGGSGIGQMLPSSYSMYNVPSQYRSMYYDTPDYHYRYAPGAIYQVDPRSNLITGVPMLLANDLSLGQPLPLGYDAYNVPMAYRDNYYDSPTAMYRYNDGHIYQVDPTTRLITAIIDAIV